MEASFSRIRWQAPTLTFYVEYGDLKKDLWFTLPTGVERPHDDLIAGVFATLVGPDLDGLSMELTISKPIKEAIESFCGCQLSSGVQSDEVDWSTGFDGHALSFSGGFDSLAALALLPGSPELVSMDFGGWFERETSFFTRFSPHVVQTNFRMEGLGRKSWMFMLAGVVLLKEHLRLGRYTTGSILESSPWHYLRNHEGVFKAVPLLRAFGFEQVNTTIGITEVATTLLTMKHFPEHVAGSLKSLAAPGSGKSLRKNMLVQALRREGHGPTISVPDLKFSEKAPLSWGQSLTDDMLTPYMLKHCGVEATTSLMSDIPDAIIDFANASRLSFYERYHTGLYMDIGRDFEGHVQRVLSDAGILPFAERDWTEYRAATMLISKYHSVRID